jgi:POT family proton-dependent oligopeptide transporter
MQGVSAKPEKQPAGLYLLFGVEMWERFSFYGMRALLAIFLADTVSGFGWTESRASQLYGLYNGLCYLTPLLGGYLADRVLGTKRAIIIGSFLIAAGHFTLAIPSHVAFFAGLVLIILGTGFHKSNISTMVGQLYRENDPRRDGGFTIYYMGINLGAFAGPLVCGYFAESARFGWHWGFAAAGVGMVLGTALFIGLMNRYLAGVGEPPPRARPVAAAETRAPATRLTAEQKEQIAAIAIFAFFNIFFWAAYEQAGSSMSFFAKNRTDRMVLGLFEFKISWFQSINPLSIILLAPLFARLWLWLGSRGREPSTPVKFSMGLVFVALGFVLLVVAARLSEGGDKVSPLWLAGAYVMHACGELCLSPVGLSMVTKLAPDRYQSFLMGFWWTSFFVAELSAGMIASSVQKVARGELFHLIGGQADFFLMLVIVPLLMAAVLYALSGRILKLMHGRA